MAENFQLVAGHLALDFANTLDYRYDPERLVDLIPTYERFLAFAVQTGVIAGNQARKLLAETSEHNAGQALKEVIELREAVYFLFQSVAVNQSPPRSHLQTFNRFLSETRIPEIIIWNHFDFLRTCRDLVDTPKGPLWPIVDSAASLLTSSDRNHIRECGEKSCRWLFLDRSKNHSRRWCDMKLCGNRSKARQFYARKRDGEGQ
jgi:predicted RNA-binding Zn ribbon-like protein